MKHYVTQGVFMLLVPFLLKAQPYEPVSARSAGIGNASVTISDEWSSFSNIAGISSSSRFVGGVSYRNDYAIRMFRKGAAHVQGPLLKGGAVVSFYSAGNEVYRLNRFSAGYAHKINLISLGIQMHYLQISMDGSGVRKAFMLEFGGIAELLPSKLWFGASVVNFNQARMEDELLPVYMKAGLSYRPGKKLMLNTEVEKDLLYPVTTKVGIEYAVLEKFRLRTGINTHPFIQHAGAGFKNKVVQVDYAWSMHSSLGNSHQVSLLFFIK